MPLPGPLLMRPVCLVKIWGAARMAAPWGQMLAAPAGTGEVWLASDRQHVTQVAAGPLAGMGLDQVVSRWPEWMLGVGRAAGFPLLVKVLSVGDWLSVQVHPDDQDAARLEGEPWGKSEAWRVLQAEAGAQIVAGLKPGVDRAQVEAAMREGRLAEALCRVAAHKGDTFHLPAGLIHATGPGLTIFEIQQASDVTYRFYDWDRPDENGQLRPLHQEKALECLKRSGPGRPVAAQVMSHAPNRVEMLVQDPHFSLLECRLEREQELLWGQGRARVIFVSGGEGWLRPEGGQAAPLELAAGQCWVLPAGLAGLKLEPSQRPLSLFVCLA